MLVLSWEGAPTAPSTAPQAVLCAGGTQQPSSALPDVPPATREVSPHSGDPCSPPHAHSTAQPWAAVTWSSCTLCPTAGLLCGHRKLRVTPHSLSTLCSAAPGVGWEGCGRAQSSAVGWGCPRAVSHSLLWDLTTRPPPLELQLIPCNRSRASEGSSVFASWKEDPGPACFALCGCHAAQCDAPVHPQPWGFTAPHAGCSLGSPTGHPVLPSPALQRSHLTPAARLYGSPGTRLTAIELGDVREETLQDPLRLKQHSRSSSLLCSLSPGQTPPSRQCCWVAISLQSSTGQWDLLTPPAPLPAAPPRLPASGWALRPLWPRIPHAGALRVP